MMASFWRTPVNTGDKWFCLASMVDKMDQGPSVGVASKMKEKETALSGEGDRGDNGLQNSLHHIDTVGSVRRLSEKVFCGLLKPISLWR